MSDNDQFVKRILRKYLFPTILTILSTTFISFANSIMAGWFLGKEALGAINIVSSFTFLFSMFGCLISIGAATCASIAIGRNDPVSAGKYTTFALIASVAVPVIISIPCIAFYKEIMFLIADRAMYLISANYARIMIGFGFLTTLMYFPFNFLRLDARGRNATYIFGLMAVIDVILAPVFLKLNMGISSFAWAVVISTGVTDIIGLINLFGSPKCQIKPKMISFSDIPGLTREICARGSAAGLNNLCNMLRTMILNILVLRYLGYNGSGEFAVVCSIINFTAASVSGSGQTISPLVGIFHGEKDTSSMRMLMFSALRYAVVIHIVLCVIIMPCSPFIASLYGMNTEPLHAETAAAVCWVMLSLIPAALLNVFIYYYAALKKVAFSCVLTFLRAFGFVVAVSLVFFLSGHGMMFFTSFLLAEILTIVFMILIVQFEKKRNPKLSGLLLMDITPNENYISFSVANSVDGAVDAGKRMSNFFEEKEISTKLSKTLPMALEELLLILNEHCLKGHENEFTDVRIYVDSDDILLRIRCGGEVFDPITWYRERIAGMTLEEQLMDESLGMKMIDKKSKSISFQNTFGVNNFVVVL